MAIKKFTLENVHHKKDLFIKSLGFFYIFQILEKLKIKASHITILGGLFALMAVYYVAVDLKLYVIFLFLHIFLDALDGSYARFTKSQSEKGEKIDHIIDATIEILLELRIAFYIGKTWLFIIPLFFIGDLIYINLNKQKTERFPARYGMFFYPFGFFVEGMIFQAFMPILTIPLKYLYDLTQKKTT